MNSTAIQRGSLRPLSELSFGLLLLDSQDIEWALSGAGICSIGNSFGDCPYSGVIELTDESGWQVQQIWATESSRPFDLSATYELIGGEAAISPIRETIQ